VEEAARFSPTGIFQQKLNDTRNKFAIKMSNLDIDYWEYKKINSNVKTPDG